MTFRQLLAAAHQGDATGDAALALDDALRARGYRSEVFALDVDPPMRRRVRPIAELPAAAGDDVTILHFNVPSPLSEALIRLPGRKAVVYHNLTPPELLLPHCPDIARLTALGRRQLESLAASGAVDLAIGVSRYNTDDLERAGFQRTATVPLMVDLDRFETPPDPVVRHRLDAGGSGGVVFLTVGRVAPNKRIEDLLRAAAYYLRWISPQARFLVVGSTRGLERYADSLVYLHTRLQLDDRVRFVGHVELADLVAYYRAARVYVSTSVHEGFCVPLIEAMKAGVPILARHAAATPETLGDAGVLVDTDDPAAWAEMLRLLATDETLRERLRTRGRQRLAAFEPAHVAEQWVATLAGLAAEGRP